MTNAASIGIPPLFAALLAWGLSESTSRQERAYQVAIRTEEQIEHRELERRQFQRDALVGCQDALARTCRAGATCIDHLRSRVEELASTQEPLRFWVISTPEESAFQDAVFDLRQRAYTVRRRIKRQELLAKREQRAQGFRWLVQLDGLDGDPPEVAPVTTAELRGGLPSGDAQPLQAAIVSERDDLVRELRDQLATREREASELRAIIARQASALEHATRLQALTATVPPARASGSPQGVGN